MSESAREVLEYSEMLSLVAGYAGSPLGRNSILALSPDGDADAVAARLRLASEAIAYRRELAAPSRTASADAGQLQSVSFGGIDEPGEILHLIGVEGSALEIPQILSLLRLLEVAVGVRAALIGARRNFQVLAREAERIGDFAPLVRQWSGKILPSGELDDRASAQLQRIRQEIDKQRRVILSSLRHLLRQVSGEESAQDEIITVRGDRFVVPVRSQKKSQVRGVVHGSSSSGQTLYVEPIETIEANNDLVRWKEEEAREVHRILREITASFHERAEEIRETTQILARLDHAFAASRFALDYHCVIPQFCAPDQPPRFVLVAARHPLLEALLRSRQDRTAVVPLSLSLEDQTRILVISGPNTGGKTVAMKTAGLISLMALSGLPVPAERVELPFFDQVLADIGDSQSIAENLSTFSSHLLNIKSMLETATPSSLILLDELGSATDPDEAGALAVAVMERFRSLGVFAITSTHHMALKALAASSDGQGLGMTSGSMGFNEETLAPTYKLLLGRPGNSSGLSIAQRLGLPAEVLSRARAALSTAHHDIERFLTRLQQDSAAASERRIDLERRTAEMAERERDWNESREKREAERAAEWEKQLESLTRDLHQKAEAKLREIAASASAGASSGAARSGKAADIEKKAARAASQLRSTGLEGLRQAWVSHLSGTGSDDEAGQIEADKRHGEFARAGAADNRPVPRTPVAPLDPRKATAGDRVHLKSLNKTGLVRGKGNDWIEVEIGPLRTRVSYDDVAEVIPAGASGGASPLGGKANIRVKMESPTQGSLSEINVIGETADDAVRRVDKFLDNALLAQLTRVRVVHGSGMGVLKRALAEMFTTHPQVERFAQAPQSEGGAGATIVELKQ